MSRLEGLPEFPVDMAYMPAVKKRVKLAGKVDKLSHSQSKEKADEVWRRRQVTHIHISNRLSRVEAPL